MMEKFWMVFVENQRGPTYKHSSLADAMNEAERLIGYCQNRGRKAYVLEAIVGVEEVESPVKWSECNEYEYQTKIEDDIPF